MHITPIRAVADRLLRLTPTSIDPDVETAERRAREMNNPWQRQGRTHDQMVVRNMRGLALEDATALASGYYNPFDDWGGFDSRDPRVHGYDLVGPDGETIDCKSLQHAWYSGTYFSWGNAWRHHEMVDYVLGAFVFAVDDHFLVYPEFVASIEAWSPGRYLRTSRTWERRIAGRSIYKLEDEDPELLRQARWFFNDVAAARDGLCVSLRTPTERHRLYNSFYPEQKEIA